MKNGVSSYSFSPYLGDGRLTLTGVIEKAAALGFEGVELANITGNYAYDVRELKHAADNSGIELCSFATSSDFAQDPAPQLTALLREMDIAAELGCTVLRTDIYHEDVLNPYDEKVIAAVYEAAEEAKKRGLTLTTENHGGYLSTPERLDTFICKVGHENFGLLCDFCNFADADVSPLDAVSLLAPRVRHVHMKDGHLLPGDRLFPGQGWYVTRGGNYLRCAITGQGNLPLYTCVKALYQVGYDGWLIQEFEGIEDCVYAVSQGLNYTKRLLAHLDEGVWSEEK